MTATELYVYHRWGNRRLFDVAAALGEEACASELGKSFSFRTPPDASGTIRGTVMRKGQGRGAGAPP